MTWRTNQWKWRLAKRARVQHMYTPWIALGNERTYRRRCDSMAIVAEFQGEALQEKVGMCKKCKTYITEASSG